MLVSFDQSTPYHTLPIFWSTENEWRPLLRAGGGTDTYPMPTKNAAAT